MFRIYGDGGQFEPTKNGGPKFKSKPDIAYSKSRRWFWERLSRYELLTCGGITPTMSRVSDGDHENANIAGGRNANRLRMNTIRKK